MPEGGFGPGQLAEYIEAFNRDDFEGYGRFYASDVRMNYNGRVHLEGREAVEQFYARAHAQVRQKIRVLGAATDDGVLFADLEGEFRATRDCPDFSMGPWRQGERLISRSLARYDVVGGLIAAVTTARYALERP